ncbi:MAG: methylaspartate mutase subunit S [Peptococcaceae bacterium]
MKTIITGVIGVDSHIVGNRIIQRAMERAGFKVVGLGALTPAEEFINAAIETDAAAIVISSLYGQGELDCQGFRDKCSEAGLDDIRLYIGGNLAVGTQNFAEVAERYKQMGFDKVYPPTIDLKEFIEDLKKDLAE